MSTGTPAKKNTIYTFDVALRSATDSVSLQDTPTLAAGDVQVSTDNGAFGNLGTLPAVSPAGGIQVKVTLSATEMNGDDIGIAFVDQTSPKEWCDLFIHIKTSTRQIDDLAYPTTSGRSVDVTAGGTVGIDWANVEAPTTVVGLSGTTVKTATDVEADTADIQARLPAALTAGGNIKADALAVSGDSVAADTLEVFAEALDQVTGQIDSGTFAAGAIDAAAIATNAIDADALAADAVTEIQAGLSTLTAANVNAEVVDALNVDTYAEIGQEAPAATQTIRKMLAYLYKGWRNKVTQDATTYSLFNDDAATVDQKATVSDDGVTFTKGEVATGP